MLFDAADLTVVAGTRKSHLDFFFFDFLCVVQRGLGSGAPISCLTIDEQCMFLVSGSTDGTVQQWVCGSVGDFKLSNLGI